MEIRVGFSADPDDAFMFWGLASGTVDPRGYEFEPVIQDIQTLNEWALEGRLEVTAISLATYPHVHGRYVLLPHGASIGNAAGGLAPSKQRPRKVWLTSSAGGAGRPARRRRPRAPAGSA